MNDLITVIVPVYKVEKFLKRCIESILRQTYENLEIILVDDGSPDSCGAICDLYKQIDCRIIVVHKINGGLSDARNFGLEMANGEYIVFIDGDDYVELNMCECLLRHAKESNADIVSCNFYWAYENGTLKINTMSTLKPNVVYNNLKITEHYFLHGTTDLTVAWNKLYKRSLFFNGKKIMFPVGRYHEDSFVMYRLFYKSTKVVIIMDPLYYYVQREKSITSGMSAKHIRDRVAYAKEMYDFTRFIEPRLQNSMEVLGINYYYGLIDDCLKNGILKDCMCYLVDMRQHILSCAVNKKHIYSNIKFSIMFLFIKWNFAILYSKFRLKL